MSESILAIDPGPTQSAWIEYDAGKIGAFAKQDNQTILERLRRDNSGAVLVVEQIAAMGMSVGAEVFETVFWSGRFVEAWEPANWARIKRHEVKMHLCQHPRAKDGNIRQALIDLYGGDSVARGRKAAKGPLYGISGDVWAALAVAVTYSAKQRSMAV